MKQPALLLSLIIVGLSLLILLFCLSSLSRFSETHHMTPHALPLPGILAVFLFNMTMPITLHAAAEKLPGAKGFSFGLLTFALFLGFLPSAMGWPSPFSTSVGCAGAAILSAFLLLWGLGKEGSKC